MQPRTDDFYLYTILWLGVGGTLLALTGIWLATRFGRRSSCIFGGVLFLGTSVLATALWISGQPVDLVWPLLALAVACALVVAAHPTVLSWGTRRLAKPVIVWAVLLALCPIFSLVYAYRINRVSDLSALLVESGPLPRKDASFPRAMTDLSREIELFQYDVVNAPVVLDELLVDGEALNQKVIRIAGPDAACNCHGWVFTGGRYGVPTEAVDTILADNGYQVVHDVQENDVVVYRDLLDRVRHTGLVRFVGTDGLVLVESKWGPLGLYLHAPQDQPYGTLYAFFRSFRPGGHELRLEPAEARRGVLEAGTPQGD
jgi:hypothetical protein